MHVLRCLKQLLLEQSLQWLGNRDYTIFLAVLFLSFRNTVWNIYECFPFWLIPLETKTLSIKDNEFEDCYGWPPDDMIFCGADFGRFLLRFTFSLGWQCCCGLLRDTPLLWRGAYVKWENSMWILIFNKIVFYWQRLLLANVNTHDIEMCI